MIKNLFVKTRAGGERKIPHYKYFVDRNTPVGEDVDYYELTAHGGRRLIPPESIVRIEILTHNTYNCNTCSIARPSIKGTSYDYTPKELCDFCQRRSTKNRRR